MLSVQVHAKSGYFTSTCRQIPSNRVWMSFAVSTWVRELKRVKEQTNEAPFSLDQFSHRAGTVDRNHLSSGSSCPVSKQSPRTHKQICLVLCMYIYMHKKALRVVHKKLPLTLNTLCRAAARVSAAVISHVSHSILLIRAGDSP